MPITVGERLKVLRKFLKLTQTEFCDKLGINRSGYSKYELGLTNPPDAVIRTVCLTLGVDEHWLRTGEGEMFRDRSEGVQLTEQFANLLKSDDEAGIALIKFVFSLSKEERAVVMRYARKILAQDEPENPEK